MAAKKKTAKKSAPKKATAKKAPKKAATAPKTGGSFDKVGKTRTKGQILNAIADRTGLSKKDVGTLLDSMGDLIGHDLAKGPGTFNLPGLMKITVVKKPATKARKGTNPFTGEEMMFKAKPARNVVRIRALKALKDKV